MRRITLLLFLTFSAFQLSAQEETEPTARIKYNPFKTTIEDQDDIWEVKFGSTHLLPTSNSLQSKKFAFRFGIHYFYEINFSPAKRFALAIGLGYNFQQLKTNGIFKGSPDATFTLAEDISNLSNPRLNIHELNFPLELRLKLKSDLKLYLAYNFTIPVSNNMKYEVDGNDLEERNTAPLSSFQHGPSIRFGYKDFFLFTRYNLSSLFLTPEFEDVSVFSFGISLGG